MAEQLSVLIIGAGTKGAFGPVSHAEAFKQAGFRILGFYDTDRDKAIKAAERWGGEAYHNWGHVCRNETPDVISMAVSDNQHSSVLQEIGLKSFRLLFAEKPFCTSAVMAKNYVEVFKERKTPIVVNYTRRFAVGFLKLQDRIQSGELGDFLGGSGFYGNGMYHNGSHMIDMLRMLVGEVRPLGQMTQIADTKLDDPSIYGMIEVAGSPFYLGVIPRPVVNAFEATLYFTRASVYITDVGKTIAVRPVEPRADFPSESVYGHLFYRVEPEIFVPTPMEVAVANIYRHLTDGTPLLSSAENAIQVLEICQQLADFCPKESLGARFDD